MMTESFLKLISSYIYFFSIIAGSFLKDASCVIRNISQENCNHSSKWLYSLFPVESSKRDLIVMSMKLKPSAFHSALCSFYFL